MTTGPRDERDPIADTAHFRRFVDEGPQPQLGPRPRRGTVFGSGLSAIGVVLLLAIPVLLVVAGKAAGGADAPGVLSISAYSLAGLAIVLGVVGYLRDRHREEPIDVLGPIVVAAAIVAIAVIAVAS